MIERHRRKSVLQIIAERKELKNAPSEKGPATASVMGVEGWLADGFRKLRNSCQCDDDWFS